MVCTICLLPSSRRPCRVLPCCSSNISFCHMHYLAVCCVCHWYLLSIVPLSFTELMLNVEVMLKILMTLLFVIVVGVAVMFVVMTAVVVCHCRCRCCNDCCIDCCVECCCCLPLLSLSSKKRKIRAAPTHVVAAQTREKVKPIRWCGEERRPKAKLKVENCRVATIPTNCCCWII